MVRRFNQSLGNVSSELAGERQELASSLHNLGIALGQVSSFVQDNRDVLGRNIKGLNQVSQVLVKRRDELDKILDTAPLALNNLALTYNPEAGTLDTSANMGEILNQVRSDPSTFLCGVLLQADKSGALCQLAQQALERPGAGPGRAASGGDLFDRSLGGLVGGAR